MHPGKTRLLTNTGLAAIHANDIGLALEISNTLCKKESSLPNGWLLLGQVRESQGHFDEAKNAFRHGVSISPNSVEALTLLAELLIRMKEWEEAIEIYTRLKTLSPSTSTYNNLGLCLKGVGKLDDAIQCLRACLKMTLAIGLDEIVPEIQQSMDHQKAHQAMYALHRFMGEMRIPFFLFSGTLLGIHRSGKLLPKDKDLDFALPDAIPRLSLLDALRTHAFLSPSEQQIRSKVDGRRLIGVLHVPTGVSIDLFFAKRDGEHIYFGFDHQPMDLLWRVRRFKLKPIKFAGLEWLTPDPPEQYLEDFYGPD